MNSFYNLKPERRGVKQFVLTTFLLLFGALFFKATAQVSVTATSGTTGPTTYTTVNAAFAAINAGTHQGAITIMVTANTTETAPATQLLSSGTGSSVYTSILIQPQGNVTINSAAVPTASRGILEFIGADNVTIDGDDPLTTGERNLTIQVAVTTNASTACVRFSSASATANGCLNVIVKNCNIVGGRSSAIVTTASYGIYSGSNTVPGTVTTVTGAADNDNMLIENNNITRCYYGIYTYGLSAYPQDNLVIRNNVIGTNVMADNVGLRGILTAFTQATPTANSVIIEGNDIRVGDTLSGYSASVAGIDIATTNAGAIIRNNNIHDVAQPTVGGYGAFGIVFNSAVANAGIKVYNNFIRDITAFHYTSSSSTFTNYGIFVNTAVTNLSILHNTIVLNKKNSGSGVNFSACISINSTTATLAELRNNILVNNQTDGSGQFNLGVYLASVLNFTSGVAINRNNYWAPDVSGYAGRVGTVSYQTINAFKAVTNKDSNSINFSPTFVSSTDLHLQSGGSSPFESVGDTTWLTTDYDGNVRPGPLGSVNGGGFAPDLGADEADMGLPSIASVGTGTTSNITTVFASVGGNIINNGGSNVIASGIVLSTSPAPVRGAFGVIDSATNPLITSGTFTVNIGNLTLGTTYYYRAYAVNSIGTAYGPDSTFTTNAANVIPTVLKSAATNLQAYTATVGGNITSNGGDPVLASGIVYSTTPMPVLSGLGVVDSTTNPLVALGTYSKPIGGLTHSTKYYYRAYATNSIGTAYSLQDSFTTSPVVSNLPYVQNFDSIGNTGWGSEIVTGIPNNWVVGAPTKTIISGSYSAPNAWITGLAIAYENNHDAVLVSPQFDFTGQTSNTILRFKHKFATEACCDGGYLEISIGGGAWTKIENVVGTGANFNTINGTAWYNGTARGNSWNNLSSAFSTAVNGWITSSISLPGTANQSNVKIRFRFISDVSSVNDGWAIDDIEVFAPIAPTVATGTKTNVTTSGVTLAGNITNNGGNAITASGFVISTSPAPVRGGFGVVDSATNPLVTGGTFTKNVADLIPATTYYYRAYAVNGVGTSYGADSSFTTNASAVVPTVLKTNPTNLQAYSATLGGNITSDGGSAVIASGIVYSTTPMPALFGLGVVDSTTTPAVVSGLFSVNPAGLTHSTKYYFRAYATNSVGTAYSVEDSFTTSPVVSNLPYMQNFDAAGNTGWSSAIVTGTANNWVLGTPAKTFLNGAASAPNAWVTSLTGNYDNSQNAAVVSPQFDFTTATASPILRFKHKFVTENNYDAMVVEMSVNGGAWTKVDPNLGTGTNFNTAISTAWYNNNGANGPIVPAKFSGDPGSSAYSSQVNGWITSTTSLAGAAGQSNVKIRFRFGSDGSGFREGFAIDDIEVFAPAAPTVATGTKTNITTASVTLAGNISNDGGNAVTASGFVISTSPAPVRGGFGVIDSATNPIVTGGTYTKNVANLFAATTYYYRAYAVNGIGTSYGADSSFTTNASAVIPTVVRVAATNVNATVATVGGNITSDGGSTVFASGVVYSTTPLPILFGSGVVDSTTSPAVTTGLFNINPAGLTHSTKYYYRAYATNAVGTAYSVEDSFTTAPIISTLPYAQNFEGTGNTGWGSMLTSTNSNVNWIVGLATYNNWVLGTPAKTYLSGAKSGTKAWVTKTTGDYDTDHDASLVSPQFNFGALTSDPIVRFNHKFKCETEWDGLIVEVSINGGFWRRADSTVGTGGNFNSTASYSWYNTNITNTGASSVAPYFSTDLGSASVYSSQTNGWIESAFKLTGAAGQSNVRFRFRFIADAFVTDEGWAIDDIEVVNVVTPTIAASNVTATPAATSANVSFTAGNGTGRMVVARLTSVLAVAPTNNTMYGASAVYGSTNTTGTGNYIVYMGNGTSVNVTGLTAATGYTFDVYEYNGKYMHINFASGINSSTTTTPVKLLSFTAEKQNADVRLSWITASEKNNAGFNVERSIDGKTFEVVNFVKGSNNASRTNYVSTDKDAFAVTGVNKLYYRLQQLDENGKFEYSTVVPVVNTEALTSEITAYPNPFNDKLTVTISDAKAGVATIEVMDLSGRLMYSVNQTIDNGNQTLTINELSNLSQGVYFVRISTSGNTKVVKMIKQ